MDIAQDFKTTRRTLARKPALSALVILTVALAVGASTAVFSLVQAVIVRQLPYEQPDRLTWIWQVWTGGNSGSFSIPDLVVYRDNRAFKRISAFRLWGANLTDSGEPERLAGIRVSENFFEVLGVHAAVGRRFAESELRGTKTRVAMLTNGLWRRRFGANPSIVGQSVSLNGEPYTIVGVLATDFVFPIPEAEVAVPLAMEFDPARAQPAVNVLRLVGRLNDGITLAQATEDLTRLTARLRTLYPKENAGKRGVRLVPVTDEIVGNYRAMLWLLFGAVNGVLLMACANIAILLLTNAAAQQKEFAIRVALGARRLDLISQSLIESAVLAVIGGIGGVLLARSVMASVPAWVPADIPRIAQASVNLPVMVFALGVSLLSGLLFGVIPAWHASRPTTEDRLRGFARGSTAAGARRTRNRLLASETACTVMLLIAAGLLLRSFVRLQSVSLGFDSEQLLSARLSLPPSRYADAASIGRFCEDYTARIRALPGVRFASAVSVLPLSGYRASSDFTVEGQPPPPADQIPQAQYRMVGPGYFETMRIPIQAGREFDTHDRSGAPLVGIVNQTLATRYFPNGGAVGSRIVIDDGEAGLTVQIVGISGDVRHLSLDQQPDNDLYVPIDQIPRVDVSSLTNSMYWVIRTSADPMTIAASLPRELHVVDRDVPISSVRTMSQVMGRAVAPRRFNVVLFGFFAIAALLLALLGVYGVSTQMVQQRQREIGIRMALGARQGEVVRLIAIDGVQPVALGIVLGMAGALIGSQFVRAFLYDLNPRDPATYAIVGVGLFVVAAAAAIIPARLASRVDPRVTLSAE